MNLQYIPAVSISILDLRTRLLNTGMMQRPGLLPAQTVTGNTGRMNDNALTLHCFGHRLKQLVQTAGNLPIAAERGVPASTAHGWSKQSQLEIVSLELSDFNMMQPQCEVIGLLTSIGTILGQPSGSEKPWLCIDREFFLTGMPQLG